MRTSSYAVRFVCAVLAVPGCLALAQYRLLDAPPPGAPTDICTVVPTSDTAALRVIAGPAPVPFVFACGFNRPANVCVSEEMTPGGRDLPSTARLQAGVQKGAWTCVAFTSVFGWMPSDRLAPLPATPAVPLVNWLGWWTNVRQIKGYKGDRLLIVRGPAPGTVHVSGRAYWYGANDNVHFGEVVADAKPFGDTLHIVEGDDTGGCAIDLVFDAATHSFAAEDNMGCGGMNVRFNGTWRRFHPGNAKK